MTDNPRADGGRTSQPDRLTYEVEADESPSEAVVRAVAALTNRPPLDLEPLYNVIDPDHIDGAFAGGDDAGAAELSFSFAGCAVTVTDEHVRVHVKADDV